MTLKILSLLVCTSLSYAVEPTPKSPSKEKVESIQRSGGALKVKETPADIELDPAKHPDDPAMRVIEQTTEKNRETLPVETPEHHWGLSLQAGLPHPINVGVLYLHSSNFFSAEAQAGSFEIQNVQDTDIEIQNQELNLRYHPFAGAFYVGLGYGKQEVDVKGEDVIGGQNVKAKVTYKSDYSLPHFGWMSGIKNGGFFWAFEAGWQMPSNGKTKIKTNIDLTGTPEYDDLINDINDNVKKTGKKSIPNVALIKFGWLF